MKLVYMAQTAILDEYAHNVQIMKMCEAFAQNGLEVTLVLPKSNNPENINFFNLYNVNENFKIVEVPYINLNRGSSKSIYYLIKIVSFLVTSRIFLSFYDYDCLYTRELYAGPFFRNILVELHALPKNISNLKKRILANVSGVVVITSHIKEKLVEIGLKSSKIFVAFDGVRLVDFSTEYSVDQARNILELDKDLILFGYVGSLKTMGMEKGVSEAILSLNYLSEKYKLYIVGGEPQDIDYYKSFAEINKLNSRVIFAGRVLQKDVPLNISVCNIVTAPFPINDHYNFYMSPLKIFEYMASKRPMVVTDLPSLKDVLVDEETALFVPPSDPKALSEAIKRLNEDNLLSAKLAKNAYNEVVAKYTWDIRARNILNFIKQ